jgi:hypothetical protein
MELLVAVAYQAQSQAAQLLELVAVVVEAGLELEELQLLVEVLEVLTQLELLELLILVAVAVAVELRTQAPEVVQVDLVF